MQKQLITSGIFIGDSKFKPLWYSNHSWYLFVIISIGKTM